jgi:putative oxidoreductase
MTPVRTLARAMLATIFVQSGVQSVANPDRLVTRAKPLIDRVGPLIAKTGLPVPTETRTFVQLNGVVQLAGGLMLMTPLRRFGALALTASLVPTTIAGHPFWRTEDPAERAAHRAHFMKNLGLMGGTLLAAVDTGGQPSLRWRASRLAEDASRSVHRTAKTTASKSRIARRSAALGRKSAVFSHNLID